MRVGAFARTWPGSDPEAVIGAAGAAGFDCVQWNWACAGLGALPGAVPAEAVEAVREAAARAGLGVAAVSATYNMIHPDAGARERGRAAFAAVAGAARGIGAGIVTVCTGSRDAADQWRHHPGNEAPEAWADLLAEMRLILPVAERHGVTIGVEPERANVVDGPEAARRLLDAFPGAPLGIVLDPANLFDGAHDFRGGAVVDEAVERLGPRVVLAHAKDRRADGTVAAPGAGLVDWGRFVAGLRRAGFDGALVTHGIEPGEAAGAARFLRALA